MTEAVIGREHGTNRLLVTVGGKAVAISPNNSVPKTVSSSHCRLQVDDKGQMTLTNIKSQLSTFVNGVQISSKQITYDSRVELGDDRFALDMQALKKALGTLAPPPPVVLSLRHLEAVWNNYQTATEDIMIREQKLNNYRNLQGVFMTLGMAVLLLPQILNTEIPPVLNILRFALSIPAILIPLYFFIRGFDTSKTLVMQQKKLKQDFEKKYVCPNKRCGRFMGYAPYSQIKFIQGCSNPECGCKYTYK